MPEDWLENFMFGLSVSSQWACMAFNTCTIQWFKCLQMFVDKQCLGNVDSVFWNENIVFKCVQINVDLVIYWKYCGLHCPFKKA